MQILTLRFTGSYKLHVTIGTAPSGTSTLEEDLKAVNDSDDIFPSNKKKLLKRIEESKPFQAEDFLPETTVTTDLPDFYSTFSFIVSMLRIGMNMAIVLVLRE